MARNTAIILIIGAFVVGVAAGMGGLLFATGNVGPSGASGAATLDINAAPTANQVATLNAENEGLRATITALEAGAMAAPTEAPDAAATPETEATGESDADADADADAAAAPAERALYRITTDESEARFLIPETLSGADIVVVGATSDVAGDVIVDFADPAASQVGEIAVNARTLRTDNDFRNQAIRGLILNTGDHEFIRFVPTGFSALSSDPVAVGDTVEFEIAGDLTIAGETRAVTFAASVTVAADDRIEGLAQTEIAYADYNIVIRAPPTVTNIGDIVTLELDFVATRVE